jgi:hypothetical protein
MKTKHLVLTAFLALSINTFAQEATAVVEKTENIDSESGTVLSVKINRATEKDILKEWKSKMKNFDGDVKIKGSSAKSTEVKIESIDSNPIEVIATVKKSTEQEHIFMAMFIKNSVSISSESDLMAFTAAKTIVKNFANELSKDATADYQKEVTKAFEKLEKELENTKKDNEKAEKEKIKAKEAIEDAKNAIKEAEATIKEKTKFIADSKKTLAELASKMESQTQVVKAANDEMELFK